MTTTLDTTFKNLVESLLATSKLGTTLSFSVPGDTYDASVGTTIGGPTTYSVQGSSISSALGEYLGGEPLPAEASKTIIQAKGLTFTPARGQKVTYQSKAWTVTGVQPISVQNDVVAYKLFLEAGVSG